MRAMGGHACGRGGWALRVARREAEPGKVNHYGEPVTVGRAVGVETSAGRWLISRRIAWAPVATAPVQDSAERAAFGAPWTGFNNCTARLTGRLRAALLKVQPGELAWLRHKESCQVGT